MPRHCRGLSAPPRDFLFSSVYSKVSSVRCSKRCRACPPCNFEGLVAKDLFGTVVQRRSRGNVGGYITKDAHFTSDSACKFVR